MDMGQPFRKPTKEYQMTVVWAKWILMAHEEKKIQINLEGKSSRTGD